MAGHVISLHDLVRRYHLSQDQLDKKVSEERLRKVSRIIDDHEIVGYELGLTEAEITAISQDHRTQERQRAAMLRKWKQKFSWRATYRTLIEALLKCNRTDDARKVCKLLIHSVPPEQSGASISHSTTSHLTQDGSSSTDGAEHGNKSKNYPSPVSSQSCNRTPSQIPSGFLSENEVKRKVEDFSKRFNQMTTDTRVALEKSNTTPKQVIVFLTLPSPYQETRDEHIHFLDTLNEAADILDLFIKLNKYWDHFNYHLLKHLITAPGIERHIEKEKCEQLQEDMEKYIEEMDVFRRQATLGIYCKVFVKKKEEVPVGFKKLVTTHEWSKENTLQDVEDFRQKVAQEHQLRECLVFLKNVLFHSVEVVWWIPIVIPLPSIDPQLQGSCTTEECINTEEGQVTLGDDDLPHYYDILMVGRTGFGKSTTANRLLGIDKFTNERLRVSGAESITLWSMVEGVAKMFETGDGIESVTTKCKLLSNEHNVRVLDTPGFADTGLTKEHGLMECNLQIFRWILQEQERHNLAFSRVVYLLPNRGPPERADGTLQEEIEVMYEFLGEDIFKIMVIIATNPKKCLSKFNGEDIGITKRVFATAYERETGKHLPKCPPIVYLPFDETNVINRIVSAEVIENKPLKRKATEQTEKDKGPVVIDVTQETPIDVLIREAKQKNPGKKLQFQDRCSRCAGKLIYEESPTGRQAVRIVDKNGDEVPLEQSKCHPTFIPKHYVIMKIIGGIAHIATLGIFVGVRWYRGKTIWPGFTNSDEICPVCNLSPGSEGCSAVGKMAEIPTEGEERQLVETSHSTSLDKVQIETA